MPETPSFAASAWLLVAHLVRPQGRKGELLADLHTEYPDRFGNNARVFLAPPNFSGPADAARTAHVTSFWLPKGKSEGRIVLALDLSHSITEAEQLAGNDVLIPFAERRPLEADAVYVHDLIGCQLFDGSNEVGTIHDVLSISPPAETENAPEAAPVLVVRNSSNVEFLVPFARAYRPSLDIEHRRLHMTLPEALLDVYRPETKTTRDPQPKD